jgi:hypothetical protein
MDVVPWLPRPDFKRKVRSTSPTTCNMVMEKGESVYEKQGPRESLESFQNPDCQRS